jgi:hypothetical protein
MPSDGKSSHGLSAGELKKHMAQTKTLTDFTRQENTLSVYELFF